MAGGSDESGAAAPLSMAVKQLGQPSPDEIDKLEAYVHETLWAGKDLGGGGDPAHFLQVRVGVRVRVWLELALTLT